MAVILRKKSPRAPSIALDEALDRVLRAYEKERLHAAPVDVIAQDIGYKGANSGTALQALASLRYYGLLERPREGTLAVAKEVESFRFAPNEELKRRLLHQFLRSPPLFAELLDKYPSGLPSDANLKHELITQRRFTAPTAAAVLLAFKRSVAFAGYFDAPTPYGSSEGPASTEVGEALGPIAPAESEPPASSQELRTTAFEEDLDRIPVRLRGNRRAWLLIPVPFFEADKDRLKAQIDLLLTEEDDPPI